MGMPLGPFVPPQPVPGMLYADIALERITDPWEQRVVAISLVAAITAADTSPTTILANLAIPYATQLHPAATFRHVFLPQGNLLEPHQVDGWIREQAVREGEPSWWFSDVWVHAEDIERQDRDGVILLPGTTLRFGTRIPWTTPSQPSHPSPMERRFVEYATPLSVRQEQAVRAGGVLDMLRLTSHCFRLMWDWTPAQGATFVLTGLVPYAPSLAERVAVQNGRRPRPMSLKHLELALFTARRMGQNLALRLAEWNEKYPDWAYESPEQFSSDSGRAYRRMVP